jgi:CRP-like cAMP-binding protein
MVRTLFNQILDESLKLPVSIGAKRRHEIYDYIFKFARSDHRKGQRVLINEGNIADAVYFLLQGTYRFYHYSTFHRQELIPFLRIGPCLLGEGKSLQKSLPARFGIEVFEHSSVYILNKESILAVTQKYKEIEPRIMSLVKQQNQAFKCWKKELFLKTAGERLTQLQVIKPNLMNDFKKVDIAKHLGIRATSLSRLMREQ